MKKLLILALVFISAEVFGNIKTYKTVVMRDQVIATGASADSLAINLAASERYSVQILSTSAATIIGQISPLASVDCTNYEVIPSAVNNWGGASPVSDIMTLSNVSYPCGKIRITNAGGADITVTLVVAVKEER